MKNLIICLLLSCFFLLGNSTVVAGELDGGVQVFIIAPKAGQTVCSFELPKGYSPKNNTVEIIVRQGKGNIIYSEVSKDLIIALPSTLWGTMAITVKFEGFVFTKQISL